MVQVPECISEYVIALVQVSSNSPVSESCTYHCDGWSVLSGWVSTEEHSYAVPSGETKIGTILVSRHPLEGQFGNMPWPPKRISQYV